MPLATLIDRHIPEEHFLQSTDTKEKTKNTGGAAEHTPLMKQSWRVMIVGLASLVQQASCGKSRRMCMRVATLSQH
ncbi:hypothetical protein EJL05_11835 [Xanthomonas arboricola pv. pruni]|nr:hypothetical protein EJK96_03710 [Xanthomonas arboricola pv. pruni]RST78658.1 hypothetical protein EJL05_11835 [Xanthomonas arboricola pv. pruni]